MGNVSDGVVTHANPTPGAFRGTTVSLIVKRGDLPKISEGIEGYWRYHLVDSVAYNATPAICGAHVMSTSLPLEAWGIVTHLQERYCGKCEAGWSARVNGEAPRGVA